MIAMIVSIIYLIISFLFESVMSNIFPATFGNVSCFSTIYTIIAFAIIYPYFANEKKYYILIIIFGCLFDILYTSTILINLVLFIIVAIVIKVLNNLISDNIFMTNVMSIVCIIVYHLLSFIILNLTTSGVYGISLLLEIITHSIIMTVIYCSISYFVIKFIYNKLEIKQIK